jgi:uncharacterized membrane protein
MDEVTLARTLHVVGVVLWIGGVGFVTTVLLPAVQRIADPARRVELFEAIERRLPGRRGGRRCSSGSPGFT